MEVNYRKRKTFFLFAGVAIAIAVELIALQAAKGSFLSTPGVTSTTTTPQFHVVTFHVKGICNNDGPNFTPWAVTLGNMTKWEPTNATLAQVKNFTGFDSTLGFGSSNIAFSMPDGVYPFSLYPSAWLHIASADWNPTSGPTGSISVHGLDVFVRVISISPGGFCG